VRGELYSYIYISPTYYYLGIGFWLVLAVVTVTLAKRLISLK
jgi:hypothetical protein